MRGYGWSRDIAEGYTINEAVVDVIATADLSGWDRFAVVGHSMSSLVAMTVAQILPLRVDRLVVVAPCSPGGTDPEAAEYL